MPDLTITLTNAQAQRVAAALGVSSVPEATAVLKSILKDKVKAYEAQQASNTAFDAAGAKVDTDFGGF